MKSTRVVIAIVAILGIGIGASAVVTSINYQREQQALKEYRQNKKRHQLSIERDIRTCRNIKSVLVGTYIDDRIMPELWRDVYSESANVSSSLWEFIRSLEQYGSTIQSPYSRNKVRSAFNQVREICSKRKVELREFFQ